ncbi:MAG: hypothetical protein Kow001_03430 [Acidobacteriota bacterium]
MKIGWIARALLATTLLTMGVPVRAEVIPGRWEKLEQRRRHTPLIVTLRAGDRLDATYQGATEDALLLRSIQGQTIQVPKNEVLRVETVASDGVRDGVLWGMGLGFAGGFLAGLVACAADGGCRSEPPAFVATVYGAGGAGAGALTGLAIDSAQKKREVLYQAPQPATPGSP